METTLLFNPAQNFPFAAINNHTKLPEPKPMTNSFESTLQISTLEAELDTRLKILDQTAMVTISDLQGVIMYANDLFCSITGYGRSELIGQTHEIIRHPDLSQETVEGIYRLLEVGKSWQGTIQSKSKSGGNVWSKLTVAPVMDNMDRPSKYIWVSQDITELKRTELELYEAKQRADQRLLENIKNAFRIQTAILPSEEDLNAIYPGAFIIASPQQSVSGDFYWFTKRNDETTFVLGDGTGHGVSASFVSLIALTALEYIVKEKKEGDPGKVLTELNSFLYQALNKHKGSGLNESIDMGICVYNSSTREMKYASGKSKLYLVRKEEIYSLDSDEISIGAEPVETCIINSKKIGLQKADRVFMMSDGLGDQFGGEKNKRLGSRQVKELLIRSAYLPMKDQKEVIRKYFLHWKGENEQTDDLSLLAFQVE